MTGTRELVAIDVTGDIIAPVTGSQRRYGETAVAIMAAVLLVAIQIIATDAGNVFTRPLWLDEIHTLLVAGRLDLVTSMRSLAAGSDFNPPTLFLLYRFVGVLTGGLSETPMRAVSAISVVGTLPLVYLLLRDQFGRLAALTGAIAVWAQPLVVAMAFDARFYGPWLFSIAAFLLLLRRCLTRPPGVAAALLLAVVSVVICTIHYFGCVSWMVAVGSTVLKAKPPRRVVVRRLIPTLAGPLALVACAPFYAGQRAALSIPTWIPRTSVGEHLQSVSFVLVPAATVVALAGWGMSWAARLVTRRASHGPSADGIGTGAFLLLAQGVVPLMLVAFSLLIQPSSQQRYWIVGSLIAAPIVATAVAQSLPPLRVCVVAALVALSTIAVRGEGIASRDRIRRLREDVANATRATTEGSLVVVRERHTLYPLVRALPRLSDRLVLLDATAVYPADLLGIVNRDAARVHNEFYGFPRLASVAELRSLPGFYFIELGSAASPSQVEFPGYRIEKVGTRFFRLDRESR